MVCPLRGGARRLVKVRTRANITTLNIIRMKERRKKEIFKFFILQIKIHFKFEPWITVHHVRSYFKNLIKKNHLGWELSMFIMYWKLSMFIMYWELSIYCCLALVVIKIWRERAFEWAWASVMEHLSDDFRCQNPKFFNGRVAMINQWNRNNINWSWILHNVMLQYWNKIYIK